MKRADVEDLYGLSPLQQGILFHLIEAPGTGVYHEQVVCRLAGEVDPEALERAWQRTVERHAALRTAFVWEGIHEPVQVVHRRAGVRLERLDWRSLPEEGQRRELDRLLAEDRARGFDLRRVPLTRLWLIGLGGGEHWLVWSYPHVLLDGWSLPLVLGEVLSFHDAFRRGEDPRPPGAPLFRDYILWLKRRDRIAAEAFWRGHLDGLAGPSRLTVGKRTASLQVGQADRVLSAEATAALQAWARRHEITLSTVVHGAFALLLGRYGAGGDPVFGSTVAGRPPEVPGVDRMVGLFINTLPVRVRLDEEEQPGPWLRRLQAELAEMRRHEHVPLPEVQRWSGLPPGQPLFEALLVFENYPVAAVGSSPGGLTLKAAEVEERTHLPLVLVAVPGERLLLRASHDLGRLAPPEARRLLDHLANLLCALAEHAGTIAGLPLLGEAERHQVLLEWGGIRTSPPALAQAACLYRGFAGQAARRPEATAVVCGAERVSYGELAGRARRLAGVLRRSGVGPEVRVALFLDRSPDLVVAVLAVLAAGGAYVPVDPDSPAERAAFLLADCGAPLLVTRSGLAGSLPAGAPPALLVDGPEAAQAADEGEVDGGAGPDNAAYVIYTSGSTGRPKGVVVSRGNVARLFAQTRPWFGFGEDDVWTLFHSYAFDFSVWEIWGALLYGGRLVVVPYLTSRAPAEFAALLRREGVTVLNQTPSAFRQLIAADTADTAVGDLSLRWVIFGGEALEPASLAPWFARHGDARPRLVNMYGITETTVHVTFRPLSAADADQSVSALGVPIPDLSLQLLDPRGRPVPIGVPGEIHVGGPGLARGYLGRPGLTAERFLPDPRGDGGRLYRTGDLARFLPDGDLEYLGRSDHQVKIRGFRIELGEIEAVLSSHPAVRGSVVVARELAPGDLRLVAYVAGDRLPEAGELRAFAAKRLPESMLPSTFVPLPALPLTTNGKVDRRALPEPEAARPAGAGGRPLAGPLEELLAGIWEQVLGVSGVGPEDEFFALGGHSLLATQVASRVREVLGVDLPIRQIFETPALAELAQALAALQAAGTEGAPPPLVAVPRAGGLPLSFAQERLWFLAQLGGAPYNVYGALRLAGRLDRRALNAALDAVVARHEVLRTTFAAPAVRPVQVIRPHLDIRLPLVDLAGLDAAKEETARGLAAAEAARRFDLAAGPLLRVALVRLGTEEHVLLFTLHHTVADAWSLGILVRELSHGYAAFARGAEPDLPPLPVQYADFAVWQRGWLVGEALAVQLAYWRGRLEGAPARLELPTDRPRPPLARPAGARLDVRLPQTLSGGLEALARRSGATLFMVLLSAFDVLLCRLSGQTDLVVGTPIANRNRIETEGLIGFFVNTLALRAGLADAPPFAELLRRVRGETLGAYAHQDLPFEKLVEELAPERSPSHAPLFQVMLVHENVPEAALALPGLEAGALAVDNGASAFELTLSLAALADGLAGALEYRLDLFDASTAERLLDRFRRLLEGAVADPQARISELPLLGEAERAQLLASGEGAAEPFPEELCAHELFEARADADPAALAIAAAGGVRLTYGELDRRADQLAHALRGMGVGPEVLVGLHLSRSPAAFVAILAVLKAGGAFLPLDPSYPAERLELMLADAGAAVVLSEVRLEGEPGAGPRRIDLDAPETAALLARQPESRPARGALPGNLAYVIYTSGSTGRPKGVEIAHRGLVNLTSVLAGSLAVAGPGDRVLQFAPLSFDASVWETFMALGSGAALVLPPVGALLAGPDLRRLLAAERVTVATLPPSALASMPGGPLPDLRTLLVAGEACPPELVDLWASGRRFVDAYGPTETTVCATADDCAPGGGRPSIGRPIGNARARLLDRWLQPVPANCTGELFLGGVGLARGYRGRPDLTAERFVPDPAGSVPGARLYRTGDLARQLPDGRLDFLGRADHQLKLRGFRIEPGEVEALLRSHPGVQEAAVGAVSGERLAAWWVAAASAPAEEELRGFLRERLPAYMVPAVWMRLAALPTSESGKIDRRALSVLSASDAAPAAERPLPRTALERTLAGIWRELLNLETVGLDDNFFDLGGHSLLLVQVQRRLTEALGREVPLVDLLWHPTVGSLARHLAPEAGDGTRVSGARRARARRNAAVGVPGFAIVGMAGRFPGAADLGQFWRNLAGGVESVSFFTEEELLAAGVDPAALADPRYVRAKGVLDDAEMFDAQLFGMNPSEARLLDPQHRLFLECVWEALEDAGCDPDTADAADTAIGVFAGAAMNSYLWHLAAHPELARQASGFQAMIGNDEDFLATRASYKLNLRGPSLSVQTACSTSLVAVHLACQSLAAGECDVALAGGVAVAALRKHGHLFEEGGILSPDGHCRSFDERAAGTVAGEGVGVVVLKPLGAALAAGDRIHAVVRGSAVNNDGALKAGFTAPGVQGQAEAIGEALDLAGVDAGSISYVEAHGSGTALGDPIEVAALTEAFRGRTDRRGFCALGSVKSNIGHADAAAGVAGLLKTVLALENRTLPPTLGFERPNPRIDFAGSPFFVNAEVRPWPADGGPRRAGVSAFGLGGTNAHVVLEEAPAPVPSGPSRPWHLLVLSAADETALEAATDRLSARLRESPGESLADVAFTLQTGRRQLRRRRAVVARDAAEAAEVLTARTPGQVFDGAPALGDRPVAFLLSGLGDHYDGMARGLYESEPVFREALDACCERLAPRLGLDLRRRLYPEGDETPAVLRSSGPDLRRLLGRGKEPAGRLEETRLDHPAIFAVEIALARLWESWGIRPAAMLGYSLGEYVAAVLAGVMALEDALDLVSERALLISELPAGAMLAVPLAEEEMMPLLGGGLSLAAVNGPRLSVAAGPVEEVERLEAALAAREVVSRRLAAGHAFHSRSMEPIAGRFAAMVRKVALRPPQIPYLSNVTGTWITSAEATDPEYWVRHLCGTVRFGQGLDELLSDPDRVLLEVGPGQALSTTARQHREGGGRAVLASLRDPRESEEDAAFLQRTLGRLWLAGVKVDWRGLYARDRRRIVGLPTYPFQRRRYWVEPGVGRVRKDIADWFYVPSWRRTAPAGPLPPAEEGEWWLVLAGPGLGQEVAAELQASGRQVVTVRPGERFVRMGEREYAMPPGSRLDPGTLLAELQDQGRFPRRIVHLWGLVADGEALDLGFGSLLWLAQALAGRRDPAPVALDVVSRGLHEVVGCETVIPEAAAVLGPCLVIPREVAGTSCRSLDVVPEEGEGLAGRIVAEILAPGGEPVAALRGRHRWVRGFSPVHLEPQPAPSPVLRERGVYLITGGTGGMGLAFAGYLARSVRARLVLVQRTPLNDQRIRAVQALEEAGAEVLAVSADVADGARMRQVFDLARERFGALDGVVHTAGIGGGGLIQTQTPERVAEMFAAKIAGTRVLAGLLAEEGGGMLLLCSSLASLVGLPDRVEYSAANAFLDAFSQAAAARGGLRVVAVNWDTWNDTGMALGGDGRRAGSPALGEGMTAAEGVEALDRLLRRNLPQVAVSTQDLPALVAHFESFSLDAALDRLAEERSSLPAHPRPQLATPYAAPRNLTEEVLAGIWGELLGIDQVGIHDRFLELGGDSILSLQVVGRARRHGLHLTLAQVFERPTVAQLAQEAGVAPVARPEQGAVAGPVPMTPLQSWFWSCERPDRHHWNQSLLLRVEGGIAPAALAAAADLLLRHHDALRLRYETGADGAVRQILPLPGEPGRGRVFACLDLSALPAALRIPVLESATAALQAGFDLARGPLLRLALFDLGGGEARLMIAAHHLAMDAVSFRIVLEDLEGVYRQIADGAVPELPAKTTSFKAWTERLAERAQAPELLGEQDFWLAPERALVAPLPEDLRSGENDAASRRTLTAAVGAEETRVLLREVPRLFRADMDALLLSALAAAFTGWTGDRALLVDLEGHGREPADPEIDLSRTVGWLTTVYPVLLEPGPAADPVARLQRVQEQILAVPGRGEGWGLLRHLAGGEVKRALAALPAAEVLFVYLGQLDQALPRESLLAPATESAGPAESSRGPRSHLFEVTAAVAGGRLELTWAWSAGRHRRETVERLADATAAALEELVRRCRAVDEGRYVPALFPQAALSQEELDDLLAGIEVPDA